MRWGCVLVSILVASATLARGQPAAKPPAPAAKSPAPAAKPPAPAPAATAPVTTYRDGKILRASKTALDAKCWTPIKGTTDYELKPGCAATLDIPKVVAAFDSDGICQITGDTREVKTFLNDQGAVIASPATTQEQGPFLLVLDDKTLVRADTIARAVKDAHQPTGQSGTAPACVCTQPATGDVIVDLANGPTVLHAPDRNVVAPNRGLLVQVCHEPARSVSVVWGGTRGLTRSVIDKGDLHTDGVAGDKPVARVACAVTGLSFPPRQAGAADVKVFDGTDTSGKATLEVELEVEPRYWGAARFGLGTLFGDWRSYQVATAAGSRQPELRRSRETATFELVSGFAPYLFDLGHGGRSQSGGPNSYVAPFFGFGVLGVSPDKGVEGLTSVHLGFEIEVASNFSIAATFVYRRTRELADGYQVGAPVPAGTMADAATVPAWHPGFALVLNATPDFLQFATGKPAAAASGATR